MAMLQFFLSVLWVITQTEQNNSPNTKIKFLTIKISLDMNKKSHVLYLNAFFYRILF